MTSRALRLSLLLAALLALAPCGPNTWVGG